MEIPLIFLFSNFDHNNYCQLLFWLEASIRDGLILMKLNNQYKKTRTRGNYDLRPVRQRRSGAAVGAVRSLREESGSQGRSRKKGSGKLG